MFIRGLTIILKLFWPLGWAGACSNRCGKSFWNLNAVVQCTTICLFSELFTMVLQYFYFFLSNQEKTPLKFQGI